MNALLLSVSVPLWFILAPGLSLAADAPPKGPGPEAMSLTNARSLKLLFSGNRDVFDPWGKLHFGVTPVRSLREFSPPDFTPVAFFPGSNEVWEVLGQQMSELKAGPEPWQRLMQWKLVRAVTRDGMRFENQETVLERSAPWTDHLAIAKNGDTGEYLALKLKVDNSGFGYTAFFSRDGKDWQEHGGNPLFYDGDAMSLLWSPALRRFVCINKGLQPYRKHFIDHGGATPSLGDDTLRDRRVLMMRSSPDGRRWEPSVTLADVWNRNGLKGNIPGAYFTVPDDDDPPDLEFYSGNGFWYHDRAYMMVLNYAASPLSMQKHGPQLDNEWWTSSDGWKWERPARGVNALEVFPRIPRLETPPLIIGGNLLFPRGNLLLGMPEDRISCVSARAHGEFSTRLFTMPAGELILNAAVPAPDRPFAGDQAYVIAAVLDQKGQVLPGFEPEKCVVRNQDSRDIVLRWGEASARQLGGKNLRLRIQLRSANIYSITGK